MIFIEPTGKTSKFVISYFSLALAMSFLCSFHAAEASFLRGKANIKHSDTKKNEIAENRSAESETENKPAESITNSEQNTPAYSEEAVKHFNHGSELHQAGFLNQAIGEYREAIAADKRIEEAYSNLGIIYATQHNYPKAKEAFEEALRLKANRPTTLNGLGTVLYAEGQIKPAMEKWKEALAADPKFASAYYNMGNAFEGQKEYDQAKDCYLKAISVSPTMADAYFRLANILSKEHHLPQAELLLNKSIELSPDGEFVREAKHSIAIIESRLEKTKGKTPVVRKKQ